MFMQVEFASSFWDGVWGLVSWSIWDNEKTWTFHKDLTPLKYETKQKCIIISALLYVDSIRFGLRVDQCEIKVCV